MPVGEPHRAGRADRGVLRRGDRVRQPPAPEVRGAPDPRIGGEHRRPVVHDDRGVADRLEAELHLVHSRVFGESPIRARSYAPNVVQPSGRRRVPHVRSPHAPTVEEEVQ